MTRTAPGPVTLASLDAQERRFQRAFAAGDISLARDLYHPDVLYLSPTTRLYRWPSRIEGVDRTLEFIQLTIADVGAIAYQVAERAPVGDDAGYVQIRFDFDVGGERLRSTYVVVYRYRHGLIARQELYYDPSGEPERLDGDRAPG